MSKEVSKRGLFITLEGVEGVGKSTNLAVIQEFLDELGVDYRVSREPGGTELAEKIRELLLSHHDEKMHELTELLLVFSARSQHLETLIKPALEQGTWILCDRFTDATFAYQGGGRGLDVDAIETLQQLVQGRLRPDLTLILDLDPQTGLARAGQRGSLDRFETEEIEFFNRVRDRYRLTAQQEPERCRLIDASGSMDEVRELLLSELRQAIPALLASLG